MLMPHEMDQRIWRKGTGGTEAENRESSVPTVRQRKLVTDWLLSNCDSGRINPLQHIRNVENDSDGVAYMSSLREHSSTEFEGSSP